MGIYHFFFYPDPNPHFLKWIRFRPNEVDPDPRMDIILLFCQPFPVRWVLWHTGPFDHFRIREVWSHNLEDEFKEICLIVTEYPYVAMDTEFPGVVARPIGDFKSSSDYQYQLLRCNVDLLKIIQLGLTFFNKDGEMPQVQQINQF